VIVGEGALADERRSRLRAADARVDTCAPADYRPELLDGAAVVLCLDESLAENVAQAARARGLMIYVQDRPELSDFSMPALARRGPLQLAVSTEGLAPALARRLRQELEQLLLSGGQALDDLVAEMVRARGGGERNQLTRLADRLRIAGRIEIDP